MRTQLYITALNDRFPGVLSAGHQTRNSTWDSIIFQNTRNYVGNRDGTQRGGRRRFPNRRISRSQ
jgi:hypothetical protein